MKTVQSSNDRSFLLFLTLGGICAISGIAAALEGLFELAMLYFVAGPVLIVGAHLAFPRVAESAPLTLEELDVLIDAIHREQLLTLAEACIGGVRPYAGLNGTVFEGPVGLTLIEQDIWADYHAQRNHEDRFDQLTAAQLLVHYEREPEQHQHAHYAPLLLDDHDYWGHRGI